jgi:DMSO reductase family type II enzyme heme b subunit
MKRSELAIAGVLGIVLLASVAVVPQFVDARPAYEIPVYETESAETLDETDGVAWTRTPSSTVPLSSAGAGVPAAGDTTVDRVNVEAARTDERLYLRLTWSDSTKDIATDRVRAFADAVAVQIPANATNRPPIAMGGPENTVNVWYWAGDNTTEELLAGGPGSTTPFDESAIETNATHTDGKWRVVYSRPLETDGEFRTSIPTDADMDIALAVWNGSNMERSGQKATSEWYYLALGPGPKGPPYEVIMWGVAGLGIVITTLLTIVGIRRTGGE